jgi:hypothetical protein
MFFKKFKFLNNNQPQDNDAFPNEFGFATDGSLLIFSSVKAYEQVVASYFDSLHNVQLQRLIQQCKFPNFFSDENPNIQEKEVMDAFLGTLLNKDGVIQIGKFIYKIDIVKNQVFVLSESYKNSSYIDLVVGNTFNKHIAVFSTADDVLYLQSGEQPTNCAKLKPFETRSDAVVSPSGVRQKFYCKLKFFTGGIFFNLYAQAISEPNNSNKDNLFLELSSVWYMSRPCGQHSTVGPYAIENYQSQPDEDDINYNQKYQSYFGTRNLSNCQLRVRVKAVAKNNIATKYTSWITNY